jgi:hypothetical protein
VLEKSVLYTKDDCSVVAQCLRLFFCCQNVRWMGEYICPAYSCMWVDRCSLTFHTWIMTQHHRVYVTRFLIVYIISY